ncbi:hypothetical protein BKA62DRAFT_767589 [Auriculariales sp. MPI-PUGE-AT-0066]|nr:hypothetical protein BKA62DRAFT_767589 [Auriculariales sp. MPI-PUGE-AT-0066]
MLRSATADESLPPPWPSSLNPTSEAPMLGRGFINAHNFIYVPKPDGGRYATYTIDQSNAQRLAQVFQAKRPKTRRQNTFPCIVSSPQSKEQIHLQPLVGTADSGLFLTESTISRLNLRYTGLNEATRQGPAKVYSGVSLRFEGDLNESGSPCSYTFIQVYALPQAQRTMSKADPSSNVKRDGIIGLHHLVNHVVLSLHGDITLVERQMLQPNAELTKEFPPITLFRTALSPPTGTATIVWPLTPGMGPPSLPATPATPPSSAVLTPGDWPDIVSVPPTTLANVLAAFPPVQRDMIVTSLPTLSSAFGGGQRSAWTIVGLSVRSTVPKNAKPLIGTLDIGWNTRGMLLPAGQGI